MDAVEHVRYVLTCPQCGKTGAAEWSAADASAYLSYSDWGWRLEVSDGFERVLEDPALNTREQLLALARNA